MKMIGWIDGQFLEGEALFLSPSNTSFLRGYGAFEYFRTYGRIPFRLTDRIERLRSAAIALEIPLKESDSAIGDAVYSLIAKSGGGELTIRLLASGGAAERGLLPQSQATLFILAESLIESEHDFRSGMRAITTEYRRQLGHIKTIQYTTAILALKQAARAGAEEALYLDDAGGILEGTTCNFFGIRDGTIYTSQSREVLYGITRGLVLELLEERYPVVYENYPKAEIARLDEAFTTSSIKEIVPILAIDGMPIGRENIGPITQEVSTAYRELVLQETLDEAALRL